MQKQNLNNYDKILRPDKVKNLVGMSFGHLTVEKLIGSKNKRALYLCKCDCGNYKNLTSAQLLDYGVSSCGCYTYRFHGMFGTRFYKIWAKMKERCLNKNCAAYLSYGGRGITVCDRWHKFENFRDDMYESYLSHVNEFGEKNTSIDRIDNNGNYCKENCRWATRKEQNNNTRKNVYVKYKDRVVTMAEYSRITGNKYYVVQSMVRSGKLDSVKGDLNDECKKA